MSCRQGLAAALLWSMGLALSACGDEETLEFRPRALAAEELARSNTPVWSATVDDLDSDGRLELLLAGHRGISGAVVCALDGPVPCELKRLLPPGRDRHDCAIADVDGDGNRDIYCTSGADRGAGRGPNEFWRNLGTLQFERVHDALGASEATSRGRLARFLNIDGDAYPDLLSTAWGRRGDGRDNRSKLWQGIDGRFSPLSQNLPDSFGARCVLVLDATGNGLDDLIGCPAKTGLTALINEGRQRFRPLQLGDSGQWYWAVDGSVLADEQGVMLVASGGLRGRMFLEIYHLSASFETLSKRRLDCRQHGIDPQSPVYCGNVLLADADGDGALDLLVSRHLGFRHEEVLGDVSDLVIHGPDYREFTALPVAPYGASDRLLATPSAILQINAGESWPGSIQRFRMTPEVRE